MHMIQLNTFPKVICMDSQDIEPIHFSNLLKDKSEEKSPLLGALFLFFFFFFFFGFLFLYFLYVCIHRRASSSSSSQNQDGGSPPPIGLDPATIRGLPIFSYRSRLNHETCPESECSICLSLFQDGDKVKVLPRCHHGFHSQCVDKWLRTRSNCPLCRTSILQLGSLVDFPDNPLSAEILLG